MLQSFFIQCSSDSELEFRRAIIDLKQQEIGDYVNVVKYLGDLMMAVNWLPAGCLWAGKLSPPLCAFFGCVSSVIGLIQLIMQTNKAKTK